MNSRYQPVGRITNWYIRRNTLVLQANDKTIEIAILPNFTVKISLVRSGESVPHSYALQHPWSDATCLKPDWKEANRLLSFSAGNYTFSITLDHYGLTVSNLAGEVIVADDPKLSLGHLGDRPGHYKVLQPYERFIGLGEKTGNLDRWGRSYTQWNTDAFGYGTETDPIYASIPFYIGIHSGRLYGLFYDNTWKSEINFGASNHRFSSFLAEGGPLTYYLFLADSVSEIVSQYTQLTGKMQLPPLWAIGLQQCRYSYYPDQTVLQVAETYRRKKIPLDVIYLDIHYMDRFRVFTWSETNFPDPESVIKRLQDMGIKVVVILDPGIAVDDAYEPYQRLKATGAYLRYPDAEQYTASVWPGHCIFPDFTTDKGRQYWAQEMKPLAEVGISGYWTDMNEIASWGQSSPAIIEMGMESDTAHLPEGERSSHLEGRNVYGMQMARAAQMGAQLNKPEARPFVLTRAAYAGAQRHCAIWTGDNTASEEHLLLGVRLQNSLGLSGMPFAGMDIGGFVGECSPELFARWIQVGTFSPLMRIHSMIDSRPSEPWAYGERVEAIATNFIKLRYKLLPTLYAAFRQATITGLPVVKTLAFTHPHHAETYDYRFQNQFWFADQLLVAPCVSHQAYTAVWLPPHPGGYYCFYTGKHYHDNQIVPLESPVDRLPVLVKAGGLFLLSDVVQHTGATKSETIELHIYQGSSTNHFTYYEDSGEGYDWQLGHYLERTFSADLLQKQIHLPAQNGNYVSNFKHLKLVFHGQWPSEISVNKTIHKLTLSTQQLLSAAPNFDPLGYTPPQPHEQVTTLVVPFNQATEISW